jgi:membrane protein
MRSTPRRAAEDAGTRPGAPALPARVASAVAARAAALRERLLGTVPGQLYRRVVEVDLVNQALLLAAQAFMLLVPAFVTLAALAPLGDPAGGGAAWGRRLGLSAEATRDLQSLLPGQATVQDSTTALGALLTVVSAYSWPAALQRGYELMWGLPPQRRGVLRRRLGWLALLVGLGALSMASAPLVTGWVRAVLLVVLGVPLFTAWSWSGQHLLLGGRLPWRRLLPAALTTGTGLVVLLLLAAAHLSRSITRQFDQYGPLGVAFVLLSWLLSLAVVLLLGPLLGSFLDQRRGPAGPDPASPHGRLAAVLRPHRVEGAAAVDPPVGVRAEEVPQSLDQRGR